MPIRLKLNETFKRLIKTERVYSFHFYLSIISIPVLDSEDPTLLGVIVMDQH